MCKDEKLPRIVLGQWKLLNEWYCAEKDVTEDEFIEFVTTEMVTGYLKATNEHIKQRMFGGFPCADFPDTRVHIFHSTGHYTYVHWNTNLNDEERKAIWQTIMEVNDDQILDREAIFTSDMPVLEEGE